jgi:hypothetical protein
MGNFSVLLGAEVLFRALPHLDALAWGGGERLLAVALAEIQNLPFEQALTSQWRQTVLQRAFRSGPPGQSRTLLPDFLQDGADVFLRENVATRESDPRLFPMGKKFPIVINGQTIGKLFSLIDHFAVPYERYWTTYGDKRHNLRFHISGVSCPYQCDFCGLPTGRPVFAPVAAAVEAFQHARSAHPEINDFSYTDDNLLPGDSEHKDLLQQLAAGIQQTPEWAMRAVSLKTLAEKTGLTPEKAESTWGQLIAAGFIDFRGILLPEPAGVKTIPGLSAAESRRLFDFLQAARQEELTIYNQCRPDSIKEEDKVWLPFVRKTGFRIMAVGAEAFAQKTLDELVKKTTVARATFTIQTLREKGWKVIANLILFPPNVILDDLFQTFKTALEFCRDKLIEIDPNFSLKAYSAAPLFERIVQGEKYQGKGARELAKMPWVKETGVVYREISGVKIPKHFKIIRPLMDKLCEQTEKLGEQAVKETDTSYNDL